MHVRGWCADSRLARVRLAGERDAALSKVAQLEEECRILRARMATMPPARRPHHPTAGAARDLSLRAATGWTVAEAARRFQVSESTIRSWMKRLDEEGEQALVRLPAPVNRYPDLVTHLVQKLRATLPAMGKVRIADMLARAGLHLAPSTVGRMSKLDLVPEPPGDAGGRETEVAPTPAPAATSKPEPAPRRVTARHPHHVWHVDLTMLPTGGWWVPWLPFTLPPRWPFCYWLVVVLDHFSRAVVGWRVVRKEPSAAEVCALLEEARRRAGTAPKHIVSDQGVQFREDYRRWCANHRVRPRYGAVGEHGSIAIIERFMRSVKEELLRRLAVVPLALPAMEAEVSAYIAWYLTHRPHQGLGGRTPAEVLDGVEPARDLTCLEPRARYPVPQSSPQPRDVQKGLVVDIDYLEDRQHLPIVSVREAA